MALTPEEANALAKKALDAAKIWVDIASIIMTGGDPNASDFYELMRKAGEAQTAAQTLISQWISETTDNV